MPSILYGRQAYRRTNLPELKLRNMYVEASPAGEGGTVLLSRRGLSLSTTHGTGPITGIFCRDGVFSGDLFTVSGGTLYRAGTSIGAIVGTGPVRFAGRAGELLVTSGGSLYSYNGTNLVAVTFPDTASVTDIEFHDGLFIAARASSQRFYWSAVNDGRTWDALDFASAEAGPDNLRALKVVSDTLLLFGGDTIENWANTGDADLPYSRQEQRIFSKGIIGTACLDPLDNSLLFLGNDGIAYRIADVPTRISDHGIEERVSAATSLRTFTYTHNGHSFFCVQLDEETLALDMATGLWSELTTFNRDNFRGRCAASLGRTTYFGDDTNGSIWTLSGYEDGDDPLERTFTGAFPIKGGAISVDNLNIEADVGWTELLDGQGSTPVIEMRSSRDKGANWSTWRQASLGEQGHYPTDVQWRRLGAFSRPGAMFELRVTDPVDLTISDVTVNEPGGGRSR